MCGCMSVSVHDSMVEMCVMKYIVCRSILSGSGWGRLEIACLWCSGGVVFCVVNRFVLLYYMYLGHVICVFVAYSVVCF